MNNKERDEKFLKSWLKKKISITTSTVVSFLITGAIGGGAAYGATPGNKAGNGGNINSVALGQGSSVDNDSVAVGANARAVSASGGVPAVTSKGVAIGNNAKAEGSISIGELSSSNHFGVAIGYNAGAQNTTTGASFANVTIGANTRVGVQGGTQAAQGIAIGSGIQAHEGAWAKGDQSIAIGANTESTGDSSIAIGGDDLKSVSNKTSSYSDARFDKNGNKIGGNSNNTASVNNIFSRLTGRGAILNGGIGTDGTNYSQWRNTQSGQGGVALGVKSISGDIALAIGTFSEATGTNSVAIGTGAQTPQSGAVAIGGGSTTNGLQGRQITDADITLTDGTTMALTNFAGASGVLEGSMVSFGKAGNERQLKHIAPGEVTATSTDGINGSQLFAVAKKLGDDISKFKYVSIKSNDAGNKLNDGATANNAIAIGPNASTKVESAVSLGDGANVLPGPTKDKAGTLLQTVISSGSGVAIGKNATATQAGVAIGDTSSTVTSGIAIGREAKVTNKYEAASGPYVVGDSQDGYLNYDRVQNPDNLQYSKTEATGNNIFSPDRYNGQGIAIGYKAESNMFGTSLGNSAVAKLGGLALGTFAKAEGATATAIGLGANSSGARGISMGRQASATTADSVAIGTGARGGATSAGGSVAIGGGAAATGTQAIAIGGLYGNDLYSSSATKDGAGNLTKNTQASGAGSIAMGVNAVANKDNALALGGSTQVFKNEDVALGYGSKVISAPTSVTSATVGGVTYGGFAGTNPNSSLSIGSAGNERQIKNVAAGEISATSTDAINGSQLYSVANKLSQGWTATADGNKIGTATPTAVKPGNTVVYSAGSNLQVKQTVDATNGKQTYEYSLNKDLTGLDSVTTKTITIPGATPGTNDVVIGKDGISAGNKVIKDVAPGVNGTDAVNKNQLDQKIGDNTIKLGGDTGTTATQNLSKAGGLQFNVVGANGIETSAAGTDVTVKLDAATKGKIDNAADKNLSNLTPAGKDVIKDTAAWKVKANNNTAETVKGGDEVVFKDGAGVTITQNGKEFTIAADTSKISKDTKISYTANGAAPKKEVSLADGFNFEDGTLTTASVDTAGKVKYDVKTSALTSTPDGKVTVPTTDGVATAKDVANAINNSGWKANADATGTGIKTGTPSAKLVKNGSTVSYVAGDNLTVAQDVTAGDHKYTYSLNKVLKDLTSAEFKTPAGDKTVINGDGLTVSPATPTTSPISVTKDGISAGDKKVTNVAPGTISKTSTDAINGSQLYNLASNTIQLGGDKGATDKQQLDNAGGIKFDIVGANGITTEAKDGKVTVSVDTSTIGANTKLKYKSNSDAATSQEVKLSDGLDFKNGNFTTATVGANGEVKYDTVTQGLTVGPDGKASLPNPATPGATTPNGLVTAQDVADALNSVGWKATADATGTGVKTGTPSAQLVKNGSTVSYVAGDNLAVEQNVDANGNHKYTYSLNKQLKDLTSAEFVNPTSGNKTVVNGDGLTITPSTPGAKNISITKDGISAGDKKITDVADGDITPTSKDAINGSQLYKLASNTISLGGDNSTVTATQQLNKNGGIKFNIVGDNGIITEAKDDKVIVRVNPATIGSNITLKYAANGANGQTVKLSDGLNFQDGNFTKASVDAQGKVKYDTVTQAIAPTADGTAQVAPGSTPGLATSADVVNAINNSGWKATAGGNVTGTPTSTVVKNGQEVEFNAGDNLKVKQTIDPTTGKQTYEYSLNKDLTGLNSAEFTNAAGDKTKITAGNTEYTNAAGDKTVVNAGGLTISSSTPGAKDISVTKDGISAGDKVIKNVAAGVNDTDAVNVSQLKDVDNKITNVNNTINKGLNFKGNTGATVNKQLGDTLEIVGEGTKADSEYSGQNLKVVEDGGKLVVKMDKNLKSDTVTADTVNTNSVTVGAPGKDGVITVKDANGKDGVSINGKDGSIGLNGKDGSSATISTVQGNPGVNGTPGTTMDRIQYTDNSGTPHQVATLDDGMKYGGDTGAVINKKLNQQVNVVGGITDVTKLAANDNIGVVSDGSNNLKVRLAKDLDGLETVTVRDASGNTTVVKGDGVTITSSSGDTVSLTDKGLDNGGNVIKNVAAGKDGTDAVNVDQLNQTVSNVVNAAGDAIAHVNNKVDKLGDRVNKGLAGAAAMAGLEFMDIGINQATVAAAVGGYRGTHAVAVGIQAAPTENTRINAKVSMTPGSRTETMYSVGASYRFNWR